jgi:hypothetical protein
MQTNAKQLKIPLFVRMRSTAWGLDGSGFGPYLAALVDRRALGDARVLGIDGNADMLLGIVNRTWPVGSFVAVEPDLVTAAFFASHLPEHVELIVTDLEARRAETIASISAHAPFDVMVVRTDPAKMTRDHLSWLLGELRKVAAPDAKLVVTLALALTTLAGSGAGDRLADRGLLDQVDRYLEYEWELGVIPVYTPDFVSELADTTGWRVDEICEPRRGFPQHHLVLRATD